MSELLLFSWPGACEAGTAGKVASQLRKVICQTKVSYYAPAALAASHCLPDDLAANLAGINALTDALVAS